MKRVNFISLVVGAGVGLLLFALTYMIVAGLISDLTGYEIIDILLKVVTGSFAGLVVVIFTVFPGFQALPEVSKSIISIAGYRMQKYVFSEGPAWRPPYIGKFLIESTKIVTYDFPDLLCMSLDNQEVRIDGAVQCRVSDVNTALEVEDFQKTLKQAYENAVRVAAHGKQAEELPGSKNWVAEMIRNGGEVRQEDGSVIVLEKLEGVVEGYGRNIVSLSITEIRLSEKYTQALEDQRLEIVQTGAEDKDTETLIRNFEKAHAALGSKGVSGNNILAALQARRGYSKNINVSGGSAIERGAAILAETLQLQSSPKPQTPEKASETTDSKPPNKNRRRRQ